MGGPCGEAVAAGGALPRGADGIVALLAAPLPLLHPCIPGGAVGRCRHLSLVPAILLLLKLPGAVGHIPCSLQGLGWGVGCGGRAVLFDPDAPPPHLDACASPPVLPRIGSLSSLCSKHLESASVAYQSCPLHSPRRPLHPLPSLWTTCPLGTLPCGWTVLCCCAFPPGWSSVHGAWVG
jgi:hypothetical protein